MTGMNSALYPDSVISALSQLLDLDLHDVQIRSINLEQRNNYGGYTHIIITLYEENGLETLKFKKNLNTYPIETIPHGDLTNLSQMGISEKDIMCFGMVFKDVETENWTESYSIDIFQTSTFSDDEYNIIIITDYPIPIVDHG